MAGLAQNPTAISAFTYVAVAVALVAKDHQAGAGAGITVRIGPVLPDLRRPACAIATNTKDCVIGADPTVENFEKRAGAINVVAALSTRSRIWDHGAWGCRSVHEVLQCLGSRRFGDCKLVIC